MTIRVLLNGSIYTPADPYATAILTEHGTVRWAGSDAGARSITDNTMETIDLNGRLVTPTFTRALAPVTGKTTAEILTYLTTAQTIRRTHPHLTLRLDTIKTTPEETLNDQELQALANSRVSLGLQTTAENADLARRANTIGTPISIGSDPTLDAPLGWQAVKIFTTAPHGISARSAFAALTRSPHRALADANPFAGQLAPDTPANLAIWNVTELMVQAPDSRVASWSTDPRARIPLLPALDVPLPTLERLYTQEQ